jgi:agmatine/peptidylarginine deiminase
MKKIITLALAVCSMLTIAMAQSTDIQQARRTFYMQHNQRVPQMNEKLLQRGLVAPSTTSKAQTSSALPTNRWFPGEWEEVKAICITWPYNAYPAGHVGDEYWTADEMVTGYGEYYHYSNGWQSAGMGAVVNVIDTATKDFELVFAHLADAIQQGGAQAWIRISNAGDSSIIKRYMARQGLGMTSYRWIVASGNSFWYRDCGPICFYYGDQDSVGMLDYMYYPGRALDDSLPYAIEAQMGIPNWETTIEWEGGNCLVDGTGMCFSSDAIYGNNQDTYGQLTWDGVNTSSIGYTTKTALTQKQVKDSMSHLIGTRAMYILPALKYDGGTGHVDLYADMWDENEFVFSRFPSIYSSWSDAVIAGKNIDTLGGKQSVFNMNYKHMNIPFPCNSNGGNFSSQSDYNDSYTRTYSNHTFVNKLIIQPCFSAVVNGEPSSAWDKARIDSLKSSYPGYTIYPINVTSFDGSGGAIHCITKQIPADNPVRILHPSITGNQGTGYTANGNVPIKVIAHNKSGIASVKCYYRVNKGDWNELSLDASNETSTYGNVYGTALPGSVLQVAEGLTYNTIEYYISVTSNNGKTMTKPMTASQGGYYTFYVGGTNNNPVAIEEADNNAFGKFFPNPTTNSASISVNIESSSCQVNVLDMMGRIVLTDNVSGTGNYTLNMQKLSAGVYTVIFTTNDGTRVVRRLVKE